MSTIIRGTEFSYRIDTEHGVNHDGFIAEGTESSAGICAIPVR